MYLATTSRTCSAFMLPVLSLLFLLGTPTGPSYAAPDPDPATSTPAKTLDFSAFDPDKALQALPPLREGVVLSDGEDLAALYNKGSYEALLKQIKKTRIKEQPQATQHSLKLLKAFSLLQQGDEKRGIRLLRTTYQQRRGTSDTLVGMGIALLLSMEHSGDTALTRAARNAFQEALWFKRFTLLTPTHAQAGLSLVELYEGNLQAAFQLLNTGTHNPDLLTAAAHQLMKFGQSKEAGQLMQRGGRKDGNSPEALRMEATMLLQQVKGLQDGIRARKALQIARKVFAAETKEQGYRGPATPVLVEALLKNGLLEEAGNALARAKKDGLAATVQAKLEQQLAQEMEARAQSSVQ